MSLLLGIAVLAFAVLLGGLAALFREPARGAIAVLRTFAVVAAASIALLHLLPEAIAAAGWGALLAAAAGALGPSLLERLAHDHHDHEHDAPTTALAMGYAAVVAHQAGEGAALASLSKTGALSAGIVLAIAAHTIPLSMVVSIRVAEVRGAGGRGARKATAIALAGVASATAVGAAFGLLVGGDRLQAAQPWLLAAVAGLLLHALSHDAAPAALIGLRARVWDALAGWAGLALACFGIESGGWIERVPFIARVALITALATAITARSAWATSRARSDR